MNARTVQIVRSVSIIGGTAALIAGVTYAAFTSNTVALADNELTVDTDVLRIWDGSTFDGDATGFSSSLIPGVEGAKHAFYLKNISGADLGLAAKLNHTPTYTNVSTAAGVHVKFYDKDGTTVLANKTLSELLTDQSLSDQLNAGAEGNGSVAGTEGNYFYSLTIDASAVSGSPASVSDIDFEFTGTSL